jgi:hypothetical protein
VPHQQNSKLSWVINRDKNCIKFSIGTAVIVIGLRLRSFLRTAN